MKQNYCAWCLSPNKVPDNFNDSTDAVYCTKGCRDAETLFKMMYSDGEIHRRDHYDELTKGEDDGQ